MARKTPKTWHISVNDREIALCGETVKPHKKFNPKPQDTGCLNCQTEMVRMHDETEEFVRIMAQKLNAVMDVATPSDAMIEWMANR